MNLILLFPDDFLDERRVRLAGRRFAHLSSVHRAAAGDELTVGVEGGRMGKGRVVHLGSDDAELEVTLDRDPPPKLPLTLILAMPRPKVFNRLLASASSLGIPRIVVIHCWRVEKSFWHSPRLSPANIRHQLILGLEQAGDTLLPDVTFRRRFTPFVEDELPGLADGSRCLVAHPGVARSLSPSRGGEVTLTVGPEGGFIANEIEMFRARGFEPVSLGPRILRVETVVPFITARLFP